MPQKTLTANFVDTVKMEKQTDFYDVHTPGLGLRVSPGGAKTFFYRYRYQGKNRRYSIGRYSKAFRLTDARTRVDELRSYTKKGGDPVGEEQDKRNKEAPKSFLEVINEYQKRHFVKLKESTRIDYERRINHFINDFGKRKVERPINGIQRIELLNWLEDKALTAPTQAQRIQATLSGVFKFALDRGYTTENIAQRISFSEERKIHKENRENKKWENVAFDELQIKALWRAFDEHAEPTGSLFKMLMLLGQRSGETRKMKWEFIDFKKELWTIPKSDTKNGEEHFVPLPNMALDILHYLQPLTGESEYVFESPVNKGKPLGSPQKTAQRIRDNSDKKNRLEAFNIHSLRTTFATWQAELGTPPQILSKLMNHKRPGEGSLVTAIYNQYNYEKEKRLAINKWNYKLHQIITGEKATVHELKQAK